MLFKSSLIFKAHFAFIEYLEKFSRAWKIYLYLHKVYVYYYLYV